MFFMLDNFDSFVYNLSACFQELGQEILVRRADEVSLSQIESLKPEGIILSRGRNVRPMQFSPFKSFINSRAGCLFWGFVWAIRPLHITMEPR